MDGELDRLNAAIRLRENLRAKYHAAPKDTKAFVELREVFFAAGDEVTVAFDAYQQAVAAGMENVR